MGEHNMRSKPWLRVLLGLGLLLPAVVCCVSVLVLPTAVTIFNSLQHKDLLRGQAQFVGLANYVRLFEILPQVLGPTLSLLIVRLLVVALVPLLLAFFVNEFGRWVRVPLRLLFTIPLALFAPVAAGLAWREVLHPQRGLLNALLLSLGVGRPPAWLANPDLALPILLLIEGLTTFVIACGAGLVVYLAALRGSGARASSWRRVWLPLLISWVVGLSIAAVLPLPSFAASYVLTGGGPGRATATLGTHLFTSGFQRMDAGYASAVATLLLIVMMPIGLLVGLVVVLGGLRLEVGDRRSRSGLLTGQGRPGWLKAIAVVLLVGLLLLILPACLLGSGLPWVGTLLMSLRSGSGLTEIFPASPTLEAYHTAAEMLEFFGPIWRNTILPPLVAVLVFQIPIAYIGALGIGALRPFKKWSEVLLLLFSPWLLVGIVPLSLAFFQAGMVAGLLDTWQALIPPIVISVPALFVLTLFFKGREPRWRAAQAEGQPPVRAFFNQLVLPSLPLVALIACVSLLLSVQDLLWPLLVSRRPESAPVSLAVMHLARSATHPSVAAAGIIRLQLPLFAFFFLSFALLQTLYLDRLALVSGEPDAIEPPDDEAPSAPQVEPAQEARETVRLQEPESERKTVRLAMEDEGKTVRLEEPESERKTVRLEQAEDHQA